MESRDAMVFDFIKFRNLYKSANYYWGMVRCNAYDLAQRFRITVDRAERWIIMFEKERGRK